MIAKRFSTTRTSKDFCNLLTDAVPANFLEKLLVFSNKHATRFKAFELLLTFYDALGEPEEEFLRLLPASFDFQTLAEEGVAIPLKYEPLTGKRAVIFIVNRPRSYSAEILSLHKTNVHHSLLQLFVCISKKGLVVVILSAVFTVYVK
jgi:hypothetical protein